MTDDAPKPEIAEMPPALLPEAFKEMLSGPALYSNKMYVSNLALGTRITFLEAAEGDVERYRTAVFLTWPDAIALRDLLTQQLEKVALQIQVAEQPKAPEGDGSGQ